MSDRFDVFDSLGNKVGEFVPTGGSDGLVGLVVILLAILVPVAVVVALSLGVAILLLPLIPVGYIYGLIVLADQGFKAAKKGSLGEAITCWIIVVVSAIVVGGLVYIVAPK